MFSKILVPLDGTSEAAVALMPARTVANATGAAVNRTLTTDDNGNYQFSDLLSGTYTITETQPPLPTTLVNGFYDGADNIGSPIGTNPVKSQRIAAQ